jgi:hypothetical protein
MNASDVRDWLGKYFLLATFSIGGYILLFGGSYSVMLRIDKPTATDCFQIIIPVLLGQLTIIFRFYAGAQDTPKHDVVVPVPPWVVKWPPLLVIALLVFTVLLMALGNVANVTWAPDQNQFKTVLTFAVAVLNATTTFLVMRYFDATGRAAASQRPNTPDGLGSATYQGP